VVNDETDLRKRIAYLMTLTPSSRKEVACAVCA
jgi:hypothetical protein